MNNIKDFSMMKVFKYLCVSSILLGSLIIYESRLESDPAYFNEIVLMEPQKDFKLLNVQMIKDSVSMSHAHFLYVQKFLTEVNLEECRD